MIKYRFPVFFALMQTILMMVILSACSQESFVVNINSSTTTGICDEAVDSAANGFHSGAGTGASPYYLCTSAQVSTLMTELNLGNYITSNFILGASIDLDGIAVVPINSFEGTFDGNDEVISNFTYNGNADAAVGLFKVLTATAVVQDLTLSDVAITGGKVAGALAAQNLGTITNVTVSGTITTNVATTAGGAYTTTQGMLVGDNQGAITNSSSSGTLNITVDATLDYGEAFVGGLVGNNSLADLSNCSSSANVSMIGIDPTSNWIGFMAGGLVGANGYSVNGGAIANSSASGNINLITMSGGAWGSFGGLVGNENAGSISTSMASGNVTADTDGFYVGSLVGYNFIGTIANCYASGIATGTGASSAVGGILGYNKGPVSNVYTSAVVVASGGAGYGALCGNIQATISNSFWDSTVYIPTVPDCAIGDADCTGGSGISPSVGQSTVDMKASAIFVAAGWDFVSTWTVVTGSYPTLLPP